MRLAGLSGVQPPGVEPVLTERTANPFAAVLVRYRWLILLLPRVVVRAGLYPRASAARRPRRVDDAYRVGGFVVHVIAGGRRWPERSARSGSRVNRTCSLRRA